MTAPVLFKLHHQEGDWVVFVPDPARSPVNRVTLSYDEWLDLHQPQRLEVAITVPGGA